MIFKRSLKFIVVMLGVGSIVSCGSDNSRLRERAGIESEAAAKQAIEEQNENQKKWAAEMEADLEQRQGFIDALVGSYGAAIAGSTSNLKVRVVLSSSLPPYQPKERVRSLDEITYELNNLYLNALVAIKDEKTGSISGCVFEGVRPDFERGKFTLSSEGCASVYQFELSALDSVKRENSQDSEALAGRVMAGVIHEVQELEVISTSSMTSESIAFRLERSSQIEQVDADRLRDQVLADNNSGMSLIQQAEDDLRRRYAFLESIEGAYRGLIPMENVDFIVRMNFTLSHPAYQPNRVRSLEEIQQEMEDMSFKVEVNLGSVDGLGSAGCVFEDVVPNLRTGEIFLASEDCKRSYRVSLVVEDMDQLNSADLIESKAFDTENSFIFDKLRANIRFQLRPGEYDFTLERVRSDGE